MQQHQPKTLSDMVAIQSLIQLVEQDPNLSMLPDIYKEKAIEVMFYDLKIQNNQNEDVSNKRHRSMTDEEKSE